MSASIPFVKHEDICLRCGRCCYLKIRVVQPGHKPQVFSTPFPCEHLDPETHLCRVYPTRHRQQVSCLGTTAAMQCGALPDDCPYVQRFAPPEYIGPVMQPGWSDAQWQHFDAIAAAAKAAPAVVEMVRARGKEAPPLWREVERRRETGQFGASTPAGSESVGRHLRRLLDQLGRIAAADAADVLTKDEAAEDAMQYWALAFENRKDVNKGARQFLGYLLPCLSSPVLLADSAALGRLRSVVEVFAANVRGTTERDVEEWLDGLESAGFDFGESISKPLPDPAILTGRCTRYAPRDKEDFPVTTLTNSCGDYQTR